MRGTSSNTPNNSPTPALVRGWRLTRVALHLLRGMFTAGMLFPLVSPASRKALSSAWSAHVLRIFAVKVTRLGTLPKDPGTLLVSNHVSWMDVWLLFAAQPVRFVSKADVRDWPVIGGLATKGGTIFIERTRRHHTGAITRHMLDALRQGDTVTIFPEGTTSDGRYLRPFHTSLLQPAVDHGAWVVPVAIRYLLPDGGIDTAPAYCGEITLWDSVKQILGRRQILAEVQYLAPIAAKGKTRRELARESEALISAALNLPIPHKTPGTPADPPA